METSQRKSHTALCKIYFWTATIHKWLPLLEGDNNKQVIIDSLTYLSDRNLITVYAFLIMPNHIHLIWQQNELNGKETAKGSLLKHSAHLFLKQLQAEGKSNLYEVSEINKKHEIWQRDALGIEIYSRAVAKQKLDYIHFNPVSRKWQLAKDDISYKYSSAKFYETGIDDFGFLNDIYSFFDGE
jgi:REP element-mobilizing transposase RayT